MAQILCMTEGHGAATFVGTFFPSGDGVRLCDECMPNFCAAVFQRMTGVDMSPALYLASEEGQDELPDTEGHPEEVAGTSTPSAPGESTDEPPPPAPHDADMAADPTPGGASTISESSASTPEVASTTDATSSSGSPPAERKPKKAAA